MLALLRNAIHIFAWAQSFCSIQLVFLVLLTVQNATAVMLMSYTQQRQSPDPSARFQVSHVVMMQEVTKVLASLLWCVVDVYLATRLHKYRLVNKSSDEKTVVEDLNNHNNNNNNINNTHKPAVVVVAVHTKETAGHKDDVRRKVGGETRDEVELCSSGSFRAPSHIEMWREFKRHLLGELFHPGALWMMMPAVIYAIQNYTLFVALGNIEPTLFQVTYQSKILVMAVLMRIFLNRSFSRRQWMALVLLVFGVATAQIGSQQGFSSKKQTNPIQGSYLIGITATTCAVFLSSVASVLMEAIFKGKTGAVDSYTSTKNVHLSFYSVLCFLVAQLLQGSSSSNSNNINSNSSMANANIGDDASSGFLMLFLRNYFRGFDWLVWVLVVVQALGGLLVALVIKYSDNIMKAFATGCAIVLSGFCSAYIYAFVPSNLFILVVPRIGETQRNNEFGEP